MCCYSVDFDHDTTVVRVVSRFSYAPVVRPSLYCCCRSYIAAAVSTAGPLHLSHSCPVSRLCLCPPVQPFDPLCPCRRPSPYCNYCRYYPSWVSTFSFYIYRLSCPILAAAVLLLYHADAAEILLLFPSFFPLEPPPPPCYLVLLHFLSVPPNSRLFRHSYMFARKTKLLHCFRKCYVLVEEYEFENLYKSESTVLTCNEHFEGYNFFNPYSSVNNRIQYLAVRIYFDGYHFSNPHSSVKHI